LFFVTGTKSGDIYAWSIAERKPNLVGVWKGHNKACQLMSWNFDGSKLLTGSLDGSAKIWQGFTLKADNKFTIPTFEGENLYTLKSKDVNRCQMIAWSNRGKYAIIAQFTNSKKSLLRIWDSRSGDIKHTFGEVAQTEMPYNVYVIIPHKTVESIVITAGYTSEIIFWDVHKGICLKRYVEYSLMDQCRILDGDASTSGSIFVTSNEMGCINIFSLGGTDFFVPAPDEQFFDRDHKEISIDPTTLMVTDKELRIAPHQLENKLLCDSKGQQYLPQPPNLDLSTLQMGLAKTVKESNTIEKIGKRKQNSETEAVAANKLSPSEYLSGWQARYAQGKERILKKLLANYHFLSRDQAQLQSIWQSYETITIEGQLESNQQNQRDPTQALALQIGSSMLGQQQNNEPGHRVISSLGSSTTTAVARENRQPQTSENRGSDDEADREEVKMSEEPTPYDNFPTYSSDDEEYMPSGEERENFSDGIQDVDAEDSVENEFRTRKRKEVDDGEDDYNEGSSSMDQDESDPEFGSNDEFGNSDDSEDDSDRYEESGNESGREVGRTRRRLRSQNATKECHRRLKNLSQRVKRARDDRIDKLNSLTKKSQRKKKQSMRLRSLGHSGQLSSDSEASSARIRTRSAHHKKLQEQQDEIVFHLIRLSEDVSVVATTELAPVCDICACKDNTSLLGPYYTTERSQHDENVFIDDYSVRKWFHYDCIIFNDYTFKINEDYNTHEIYEFSHAKNFLETECSRCNQPGARMHCSKEGCETAFHGYYCSVRNGCCMRKVRGDPKPTFYCGLCLPALEDCERMDIIKPRNISREWLDVTKQTRKEYVPQEGDRVIYYFQGHEDFILENELFYSDQYIWLNQPQFKEPTVFEVKKVDYVFPKNMCQSIQTKLSLMALSDETGSGEGYNFDILFFQSAMPDFLIIKEEHDYYLELNKNLMIMTTMKTYVDGTYNNALIKKISGKEDWLPKSRWENVQIDWIIDDNPDDNGQGEPSTSETIVSGGDHATPGSSTRNEGAKVKRSSPGHQHGDGKITQASISESLTRLSLWELDPIRSDFDPQVGLVQYSFRDRVGLLNKVKELSSRYIAQPFIDCADYEFNGCCYDDFISVQFYLQKIVKRIEENYYRTLKSFQADCSMIQMNAENFNEPDSEIVKHSRLITKFLLEFESGERCLDELLEETNVEEKYREMVPPTTSDDLSKSEYSIRASDNIAAMLSKQKLIDPKERSLGSGHKREKLGSSTLLKKRDSQREDADEDAGSGNSRMRSRRGCRNERDHEPRPRGRPRKNGRKNLLQRNRKTGMKIIISRTPVRRNHNILDENSNSSNDDEGNKFDQNQDSIENSDGEGEIITTRRPRRHHRRKLSSKADQKFQYKLISISSLNNNRFKSSSFHPHQQATKKLKHTQIHPTDNDSHHDAILRPRSTLASTSRTTTTTNRGRPRKSTRQSSGNRRLRARTRRVVSYAEGSDTDSEFLEDGDVGDPEEEEEEVTERRTGRGRPRKSEQRKRLKLIAERSFEDGLVNESGGLKTIEENNDGAENDVVVEEEAGDVLDFRNVKFKSGRAGAPTAQEIAEIYSGAATNGASSWGDNGKVQDSEEEQQQQEVTFPRNFMGRNRARVVSSGSLDAHFDPLSDNPDAEASDFEDASDDYHDEDIDVYPKDTGRRRLSRRAGRVVNYQE